MSTSHLFVSSTDGGLYDTRKQDWHKGEPVRKDYCRSFRRINSTVELKATIRAGGFAWPGGYALELITDDGAALCFKCAVKEFRNIASAVLNKEKNGWRVIGCCVVEEVGSRCEHCSETIA